MTGAGTRQMRLLAPALAGCLLAPPLMLADVDSPLRVAAALELFAVAPGVALLPLLRRRPALEELGLAVAMSLACCVLVAQAMLWTGLWAPRAATCALAAVCGAGLLHQLLRLRTAGGAAGDT